MLQDYYAGTSAWHHIGTVDILTATEGSHGYFSASGNHYSDVSYWGLAFFYSYRSYQDSTILATAVNIWNIVYSEAFITPDDAASGSGAGRNVTFSPPADCAATREWLHPCISLIPAQHAYQVTGGVFYVRHTFHCCRLCDTHCLLP